MKRKFIFPIVVTVLFAYTIFAATFLLCKYWNDTYEREIYLVVSPECYGILDNGEVIQRASLSYFDGIYVRTAYEDLSEINNGKMITIALYNSFDISELYIVYPEMKIFTKYKESIYTKKIYDDSLFSVLQKIYFE